jgi:nicotinate-nucleotide adenylyltransferase
VGHQIVAEAALDALGVDEVWWMPNASPPHKSASGATTEAQRLAMTRLAAEGHDRFRVTDVEMRRGGLSYTVDTLRHLTERHVRTAFTLLVGGDSWRSFFGGWREPEAILSLARLAVYPRAGASSPEVPERLRGRVTLLDAPRIDVSSTDIRTRIASGRSVRYLVPDAVRAYLHLRASRLYR